MRLLAGIITISPGHDASYPWRQIGTSPEPGRAARRGAEYYLSPAEKGGEPPGIWRGGGLADLGLVEGEVIDRAVFEQLYGEFTDPRDPVGQERLGRAPQRFRPAEEIFAVLAALEPGATAERRAELMIEAKSQVRMPVQYFDVTFSVSKSITLLHASAMANAARAAGMGDAVGAAYWEQAARDVWACVQAGNQAALEYLQREAGYTRAGYHGRDVGGVRVGRWEDAHAFIVGSFAQHTSRDGDPQLHVHNLVLNRVRRETDGQYRTLDSRALHEHRGAAAAIATLVMESALSRELGVGWVRRADGHGREVAGVSRALMAEFSSRRQSICALTEGLAREFAAQRGFAPDARALGKLRQWANHVSRDPKPGVPLDLGAEVRRWAAQARASEAGALEPLLPAVTCRRGAGVAGAGRQAQALSLVRELSQEQERELMAQALARVQEAQPTWRKADLIRHLGELLPGDVACGDGAAAAALLVDLAGAVIGGAAGEEVIALEAPEWPVVPRALRRADGRSVYRPHDGIRYATSAQLTMEERLAAQARQPGAPRMEPDVAARLLGAAQAQLEAQLRAVARGAGAGASAGAADGADLAVGAAGEAGELTGSGLRLDQAAAAFWVLTSDRRAEVLVGPAGSGKTSTAAVIARLWQEAGLGEVHGLTTSQSARNVLRAAGVELAANTAEFLGHRAGQREVLGPRSLRPGTLLILDEASMMSLADMAAIMRLAAWCGCRVLITGDHEQLAAVEGGGGMMMLTRRMGFVQLAEPVRFTHAWEAGASLRLRAGDASVLAEYDQHGRLRGGSPEEVTELACRGWLADHLAGRDALLVARTDEQARELSRRVRDDLIRYGLVTTGIEVGLRDGVVAGRGDLVMARRNARWAQAGERGRWLANRDVLRVEGASGRTVVVRRMAGRDRETGQVAWSAPFELPRAYLFSHCDLAYAVTAHAAQGRTVGACHALVDGLGDRQGLYVAMSRGADANYAYCVTGFPQAADTRPGARPAPELARARRLQKERAGAAGPGGRAEPGQEPVTTGPGRSAAVMRRDPVAVLTDVLHRDGALLSASEVLRAELSAADHLGVLGSVWYDQARRAQAARFTALLRELLAPAEADAVLADPACTWLWRSLREAEAAGRDAAEVLRPAVASRSLHDARDIARVLDSRVRRTLVGAVPQPRRAWSARVPDMGDRELDRFMAELAAAMDDRTRRIGEHAARTAPLWATQALGDVPADPLQRLDWEQRAATLGAYRELYGYDAPGDAIGPEPGKTSPEARADWHTAFTALGKVDGIDMRRYTDGQLRLQRATYEQETSWAPPHVAEELRLARLQARTAFEHATRERFEARAARATRDQESAARHERLARQWRALHFRARTVAGALAQAQETRRQWAALTEPTRRVAVAADTELRRRYPDRHLPPLRSAEPDLPAGGQRLGAAGRDASAQPSPGAATASAPAVDASPGLVGEGPPGGASRAAAGEQALAAGAGRAADGQPGAVLVAGPEPFGRDLQVQITRIMASARMAQERINELTATRVPAEEHDAPDLGPAWTILARRDREAIIQPPQPAVVPARAVLGRAQDRTAVLEMEAE